MKKKYKKDRYAKYDDIHEMYSTKIREMKLRVPSNFRMLCALLKIEPAKILEDFMWMLSYSSANDATEKKRRAAKDFFFKCGYGRATHSKEDIRQMFAELKARKRLYDTAKGMSNDDMHLYWKSEHMYMQHWFRRWFYKTRTNEDISILEKY